jgi:hypothetical protein
MANSKLLKEAIADAKAVKETALANAKLALEEAFTPRLQSILSQKLRAEAEAQDDDAEKMDEELDSSDIGAGMGKADSGVDSNKVKDLKADTDLSVGVKKSGATSANAVTDYDKVADINEEWEEGEDEKQNEIAQLRARLAELEAGDDMGQDHEDDSHFGSEEEGDDMGDDSNDFGTDDHEDMAGQDDFGGEDHNEDDLDLEAIIRELEAQLAGDEEGHEGEEGHEEDENYMGEDFSDGSAAGTDKSEDPKVVMNNELEDPTKASGKAPKGSFDKDSISEDVIDLEEILREMEADMKDGEEEKKDESVKQELAEAYQVITSLKKTINEVNLLNAKLLFANKLFRAYNMTNEQKVKVIETLDRTNSVREVKLVFSTLAENFKYATPTQKSVKKSIAEGIASKVTKSTKPAQTKQVIAENTQISDRFQKLAGIIK